MGRIRTKDIKSAGEIMLDQNRGKFTIEFETNKAQVNQYGLKLSKRVRNRLAGYITRHKRIEARG
jgi:small subunit ribosomal protein S17e